METAFSAGNVYEFFKILIETGGIHYIDKDNVIRYVSDQSPVGIKTGTGSKAPLKSVALYKPNMEIDSTKVLLNPFSEYVGFHPERDWFYKYMTGLPGNLIKFTILGMAETVLNKDRDFDPKTAAKLAEFTPRIDAKFVNEIKKIRACDIGCIMYSKDKHIAQLISALWEKEFEAGSKSALRKSSLMLVRDIVSSMLGVGIPEELKYTSTVVCCPEFDATINLLADILERISPIVEAVLPTKLHAKEIKEHLTHLEAYYKAIQWLTTSTSSPVKEVSKGPTTVTEAVATPWSSTVSPVGGTPVTPVASPTIIPNPTPPTTPVGPMAVSPVTPVTPAVPTPRTPISSITQGQPVTPRFTMPQVNMNPTAMSMFGGGFGMGMQPVAPMPMSAGMPMTAPVTPVFGGYGQQFSPAMTQALPGGW